jgi:hypothetical protein
MAILLAFQKKVRNMPADCGEYQRRAHTFRSGGSFVCAIAGKAVVRNTKSKTGTGITTSGCGESASFPSLLERISAGRLARIPEECLRSRFCCALSLNLDCLKSLLALKIREHQSAELQQS